MFPRHCGAADGAPGTMRPQKRGGRRFFRTFRTGAPLHAMAVAASGTHFPTISRPFLPEKEKSGQYPDKNDEVARSLSLRRLSPASVLPKDGFARSLSLRRLFSASVLPKRKARAEARIPSSRQGPPTRTGAGAGKGAPLHAIAVAASGTHFPTISRPFFPEIARSLSLRRLFSASVLPKKAGVEARIPSSRQGPPTRTGAGAGKGAPLHAMAVAASGTHFPTISRPFLPEKEKSEQCPDKKDGFARSLSLRRLFSASVLPKRKARREGAQPAGTTGG